MQSSCAGDYKGKHDHHSKDCYDSAHREAPGAKDKMNVVRPGWQQDSCEGRVSTKDRDFPTIQSCLPSGEPNLAEHERRGTRSRYAERKVIDLKIGYFHLAAERSISFSARPLRREGFREHNRSFGVEG